MDVDSHSSQNFRESSISSSMACKFPGCSIVPAALTSFIKGMKSHLEALPRRMELSRQRLFPRPQLTRVKRELSMPRPPSMRAKQKQLVLQPKSTRANKRQLMYRSPAIRAKQEHLIPTSICSSPPVANPKHLIRTFENYWILPVLLILLLLPHA